MNNIEPSDSIDEQISLDEYHLKINKNEEEMPNSNNEVNSLRIAQIINNNIKNARFGHIDPTSEFSIQNLRDALKKLPIVNKKRIIIRLL